MLSVERLDVDRLTKSLSDALVSLENWPRLQTLVAKQCDPGCSVEQVVLLRKDRKPHAALAKGQSVSGLL
jgi:hypothetical protein